MEAPTTEGWYDVVWEPGDRPVMVYIWPNKNGGVLWGTGPDDDPEMVSIDIREPERIEYKAAMTFSLNLCWSAEDQGYIATCPEFPGLSAFGATRAAAVIEAEIALKMFVAGYQSEGKALPAPTIIYDRTSG